MSKAKEDELVPVLMVAYEDDADLEIENNEDGQPTVQNHDEIVNSDGTFEEIRALKRSSVEEWDLDIVTPSDPLWDERFEDLESGDAWRVDELKD